MAAPAAKAELERLKGTVDMAGLPDDDGAGDADAGVEGVALAADAEALAMPDGAEDAMLGLPATPAVGPGEALVPQAPTSRDAAATATKTGALRRADRGPLPMAES